MTTTSAEGTSTTGTSTTGTSTTAGARAHARAQHGRSAAHMRHVPAPPGLTFAETIAPGGYTSVVLARGTRVRLVDPVGDACAHLLLVRADAVHERLNVADTVKVPWQAYLGAGHPLLSGFGRVLATIVADTSGHHDALAGTTTRAGNEERYGAGAPESASPAGRELLTLAALKQGLHARDVVGSVSFFQGVRVDADGALRWRGSAGAGTAVDLLLHVDTAVLLANTAHPLDPRPDFTCSALEVRAWRADDELAGVAASGPEHAQALANTDADLLGRGAL